MSEPLISGEVSTASGEAVWKLTREENPIYTNPIALAFRSDPSFATFLEVFGLFFVTILFGWRGLRFEQPHAIIFLLRAGWPIFPFTLIPVVKVISARERTPTELLRLLDLPPSIPQHLLEFGLIAMGLVWVKTRESLVLWTDI